MSKAQLATKIDEDIKDALVEYCENSGLKIRRFLEEAILDKLEELQDHAEIASLRRDKTVDFEDVIHRLKKSGKL